MSMTDPIADLLTRIRNANDQEKRRVDTPSSRVKESMAVLLKEEGFIKDYHVIRRGEKRTLRLYLKYGPEGEKIITGLQRVSRPGLRKYTKNEELPRVLGGLGVAIISTSNGILTDREARRRNIGGEVMAYIW